MPECAEACRREHALEALSKRQREQLRHEAWQLCGERFGIDRTVARYRSIYRDLVGVA